MPILAVVNLSVLIISIFNSFVAPDLVIPGLAGINAQFVIPASAQLEELLKQGYPPQFVLQQLQLAQACIVEQLYNLFCLHMFKYLVYMFTRGLMNSEPYSATGICPVLHVYMRGTGLITRRTVFTCNRMNCSPGSIYVRVRRWSQSVLIPAILYPAKWF
jgi:hypothetical protein